MVGRALVTILVAAGVLAAAGRLGHASDRTRTASEVGREAALARSGRALGMARAQRPSSLFFAQVAIWAEQQVPAPGPARVHGRTTCGCIAGAIPLPSRGEGFVRRCPWRLTGFGHPDLVQFVERLGATARRLGLGDLVIGDLSLPRGGAYRQGHASHQSGLDVDIAYRTFPDRAKPLEATSSLSPVSANTPRSRELKPIESLLRLASSDEHVDRIFVGAALKQRLCRTATGDRSFLQVLRPWLGHERHFHVRLKCPADSPNCRPNEPVLAIPDDCEALSRWWKRTDVNAAFAKWRAAEHATYLRDLPNECHALAETTGNLAQRSVPPDAPCAPPPPRRE
jgi:penicillin-insensitive murein DD-endopeptidase